MDVKGLTDAVRYTAMPVVPSSALVIPTYTGPGGATAANVLAFRSIGGAFDATRMDFIAAEWADFWQAFAADAWSIDVDAEARNLTSDPYGVFIANTGGGTGSDSSDSETPAVAMCVSTQSGSGGRRGRGRFYLPGVPISSIDEAGLIDSGFITATLADYASFGASIAGVGWVPAVYSRTDGLTRVVESASISPYVDTQRRRQGRLDA